MFVRMGPWVVEQVLEKQSERHLMQLQKKGHSRTLSHAVLGAMGNLGLDSTEKY